jgi:hypothetical protein
MSLPVSEDLLRHRDPIAISSPSNDPARLPIPDGLAQADSAGAAETAAEGTGVVSAAGSAPSSTAWPLSRQDAAPLAWWRTLPCELFREAENLVLHATLGQISLMRPRNSPVTPLVGNPAAVIAEAFDLMPLAEMTLEVDIVMSALLVSALDGDAAAALVLSYAIRHTHLDHPFAAELSASWLAWNDLSALPCRCIKSENTNRLPLPHLDDEAEAANEEHTE